MDELEQGFSVTGLTGDHLDLDDQGDDVDHDNHSHNILPYAWYIWRTLILAIWEQT